MSFSISSNTTKRFTVISFLLLLGLLSDAVFNHLNIHGLSNTTTWAYPATVPTLNDPGADLRILMEGAKQITHGMNPYGTKIAYPPPPFAAVFFYPFTWISPRSAYLVQYWILLTINFSSICLIGLCIYNSSKESFRKKTQEIYFIALIALITITILTGQLHSYGIEFAMERGNFDSYTLFLAISALTSIIFSPNRVLIPIVLLSAASHLKIYPAILLLIPLMHFGRRALIPIATINIAMFLTFGISNAKAFFGQIIGYMNTPYCWPGNHSIFSYVNQVITPTFPPAQSEQVQSWASRALTFIVIGLWLHGVIRVKNLEPKARRWLIIAAISFPLMGALSSTSHDYKLVIYALPLMINLYLYCESYLEQGRLWSVAGIALTLFCGVSISHSSIIEPWPFQETKFPALFILLLLTYFQTYGNPSLSLDQTESESFMHK